MTEKQSALGSILQVEGPSVSGFEVNGKLYKYITWGIGTYEEDEDVAYKSLWEIVNRTIDSIAFSALYEKEEGAEVRLLNDNKPLLVWRQRPEVSDHLEGGKAIYFRALIVSPEEAESVLSYLTEEVA